MSRDTARDDEVQGVLRGLLVQLPEIPTEDLDLIEQFISNYEYGLAVEVLIDTIEECHLGLSENQRLALRDAGGLAQVGPDYAHWLAPSPD